MPPNRLWDHDALVVGVDVGTTGVKAVAVGAAGVVASAERSYGANTTPDGGHQQDAAVMGRAALACLRQLTVQLAAIAEDSGPPGPGKTHPVIRAVGLSGHMHSLLLVDQKGEAVRPYMTWGDRRVRAQTGRLAATGLFPAATGNDVSDAFTAPKLAWLAQNEPDFLARARYLLLAKDYLGHMLTGRMSTDVTDAMGTLLWNIHTRTWDQALFQACGADSALGVPVLTSGSCRGFVTTGAAAATGLPAGIPVAAGAGDVSAVVAGTGVVDASSMCLNVGTAAQVMGIVANADAGPGFLFGHPLGGGYVRMASVYAAGASVQWAERTVLGGQTGAINEVAAGAPPGSAGLVYLPFMFGSAVPRKNDSMRAAFLGQADFHGPSHAARAVLEGIAFACADAVAAVASVAGQPKLLHVVGGVARSDIWRRTLATVVDLPVVHTLGGGSPLGAARLGAAAAGSADQGLALVHAALRSQPVEPLNGPEASAVRQAQQDFRRYCAALV